MTLRNAGALVLAWTLVALGCDDPPASDGGVEMDASAPRDAGSDAGETPMDAGEDASTSTDAGVDAGEVDAGIDAGAVEDAGTDAGGSIDPATIPAPRPIEPASSAFTTSSTVRFSWELRAPATGADRKSVV